VGAHVVTEHGADLPGGRGHPGVPGGGGRAAVEQQQREVGAAEQVEQTRRPAGRRVPAGGVGGPVAGVRAAGEPQVVDRAGDLAGRVDVTVRDSADSELPR
jgi:hypothetical protein